MWQHDCVSTTLQPKRKIKSLMSHIHCIYTCKSVDNNTYTPQPPPPLRSLSLHAFLDQIAPSLLLLVTLRNAAPGLRERRQLTFGANVNTVGKLQLAVRCSGMEDQETGRLNLLFYSVCFLKSNDQIYFLHEMCVKIRNYFASLLTQHVVRNI